MGKEGSKGPPPPPQNYVDDISESECGEADEDTPRQGEPDTISLDERESTPPQAPRSLLFSGINRGYVTLGRHGHHYALGSTHGQN